VVIGIDELDKMASAKEAARFLNEIKALFGHPGVYYLVSLSEDAAASFEQRGVGIRDVFESVFDSVVRVEPLSAAESVTVLQRRIIGMHPPFGELCHVLSGGLPRELIRCAREAAALAARPETQDVPVLTRRLLAARSAARQEAVGEIAGRHVRTDGTQPVLTWLRALESTLGPDELLNRCEIAPLILDVRAASEIVAELESALIGLAAWWHHAATVMQFADALTRHGLGWACTPLEDAPSLIDLLARGYLDLAVAPELSWATVSAARERLGVGAVPYPLGTGDAGVLGP
jgi:hypothetical protein